jgi:5-methylthioadenosine/S-adenosylhomocysteine deaminase
MLRQKEDRLQLLYGATIIPMTSSRDVIDEGFIVVDDGHIMQVGTGAPPLELRTSIVSQFDLNGDILIPGFINTHHHLSGGALRGVFPDSSYAMFPPKDSFGVALGRLLDGPSSRIIALSALAELIHSGVSLTADSLTPWKGSERTRGALEAAHASKLRVLHTMAFVDKTHALPTDAQFSPQSAADEYRSVASEFDDDRVTVGVEFLSLLRCSTSLIKELVRLDAPLLATHLAYTPELSDWLTDRFGMSEVGYLAQLGVVRARTLGAHPLFTSDDDLDLIGVSGMGLSYSPVSNMLIGSPPLQLERFTVRGIDIGLGIDYPNHGSNFFETIKVALLTQKMLSGDASINDGYDGLYVATMGGARALGVESSVGSLEAGKLADLCIIDGASFALSPPEGRVRLVAYNGSPSQVKSLMVGGEWVMRDRTILSFDEGEVFSERNRVSADWIESLGLSELKA